jgi:hypothetical protein
MTTKNKQTSVTGQVVAAVQKRMVALTPEQTRTPMERVVKLANGAFMIKPAKKGEFIPRGPFLFPANYEALNVEPTAYYTYNRPDAKGQWAPMLLKTHPEEYRAYLLNRAAQDAELAAFAIKEPELAAEAAK